MKNNMVGYGTGGFGRKLFAVGRIIIEIHLKTNAKQKHGTPKYMEHGNTA